ncbi:MAG: hypothetical protein UW63_C0087G0003 [Candidatus Uhrbacteria bacterium GW2011_GWF2_44_350]|uniref:Uncharacterized protein n=1 Tax=Candidatus Uhrbacteria bacterium GW2011_GWF2_44_350 TaxID=1619000 RepID=A0A0G1J9U4_9BACT|nr:MAG: hypothetical protein UW63_C0087G0003 [Candidatus Uhrbacteria bacterium GW2011_GWF2_44_350]
MSEETAIQIIKEATSSKLFGLNELRKVREGKI